LPQGRELEILEVYRGELPTEVFTTPYWNPVGESPKAVRDNLLEAMRLLELAGYAVRDFRLVNISTGEPLQVEFLLPAPTYERFVLFYEESLERLGIDVTVRVVDDVQYQNRLRNWEFEIIVTAWEETLTPGNEQREYWGSRAANTPGSRNLVGIADQAIDGLIDRVIFAGDREELVAATRALDRALLWHHYVVPQWTYGKVRTARWDRFAKPKTMPLYGAAAFPTIWWWDAERASKTGSEP
jgi:microcin C transport system substrate-binding protein